MHKFVRVLDKNGGIWKTKQNYLTQFYLQNKYQECTGRWRGNTYIFTDFEDEAPWNVHRTQFYSQNKNDVLQSWVFKKLTHAN